MHTSSAVQTMQNKWASEEKRERERKTEQKNQEYTPNVIEIICSKKVNVFSPSGAK